MQSLPPSDSPLAWACERWGGCGYGGYPFRARTRFTRRTSREQRGGVFPLSALGQVRMAEATRRGRRVSSGAERWIPKKARLKPRISRMVTDDQFMADSCLSARRRTDEVILSSAVFCIWAIGVICGRVELRTFGPRPATGAKLTCADSVGTALVGFVRRRRWPGPEVPALPRSTGGSDITRRGRRVSSGGAGGSSGGGAG